MLYCYSTVDAQGPLYKRDIVELKSLAVPAQEVKDTLVAVMAILGKRRSGVDDWKNCRKHLLDPTLLRTMVNFDPKTVRPEDAKYAQKMIADISGDAINNKSRAATSMWRWLRAILFMVSNPCLDEKSRQVIMSSRF